MWLLSGAFFPASGAPAWLAWVMRLNPLTYGTAALRRVLYPPDVLPGGGLPEMGTALAVLVGGTVAALVAALLVVEAER